MYKKRIIPIILIILLVITNSQPGLSYELVKDTDKYIAQNYFLEDDLEDNNLGILSILLIIIVIIIVLIIIKGLEGK